MLAKEEADDDFLIQRTRASARTPSPLTNVNFFQQLLFGWAWPLLKLGSLRPLEEPDLPEVHPRDSSAYNKAYIRKLWKQEQHEQHGLGRALLKDYFQTTRFPQLILLMNSASKIGQAFALGLLMEQFTEDSTTGNAGQGYIWCGVLVGCGLIAFPTKQRLYFELYRKGMQIRVGLVATLYDKVLRLSATSSENSISAGKLTNLASNDVERFLLASIPSLYLFLGPIEAVVILLLGIYTIGPVFAVGHGLFLLLVPLQVYLGRRFVQFRSQVASITDARVTLVSQAVSGARIMKMNGWELEFEKRITALRAMEVAKLKAASRYKALNEAIYYFSSTVVAVSIFSVHVLMGNELTPRKVYTTLTLLNILHLSLTKQIPSAVMNLSECYVSSNRIQAFLELPENSTLVKSSVSNVVAKEGSILSLSHVTCVWDDGTDATSKAQGTPIIALSDISLSFESGKVYYIVGMVGSGKSALIQAVAGELHATEGAFSRNYSSLAYAAQNPWIMNGSIRENIVMGRSFQQGWYDKVVDVCGLQLDLSQIANGDETTVGDRGIQISGGQRARIGLARAFYGDPQVLLLDDPLSAVDSTLARSIYQEAIQELGIKQGKCIIMATHQNQFLGHGDQCIVLDKGKMLSCGRFESTDSSSLPTAMQAEGTRKSHNAGKITDQRSTNENMNAGIENVHKEKRSTGMVEWPTWAAYGKAAGGFGICSFFFLFSTITQSALLILIVEVGSWAEAPSDAQNEPYWFAVILGLTFGVILLSIARAQLSFHLLIGVSQRLHDLMLRSVLRSNIAFFDTHPLGRILNRFSADVGISDEILPLTIYDFLVGFFIVVGGVVTASIVLPFILVALPPLVWYFMVLRLTFVKTTRELKRLEGIAWSPIFAMMSESLQGMSTVRANNYSENTLEPGLKSYMMRIRGPILSLSPRRAGSQLVWIFFLLLLATASILAVIFHDQGWFKVNPTALGLALTLLLQIAGTNFPWIVLQSAGEEPDDLC
jgi:ATP-binding cassette subfamily C (CFTR/MRP) protein 4